MMRKLSGKAFQARDYLAYSQQMMWNDGTYRAYFKKALSRWQRRQLQADLREQVNEIDELRYEMNRFAATPAPAVLVAAQVIRLADVRQIRASQERAIVVIRKPAGCHKARTEVLRAA
ncbi:MAG: hypothetical protein OEL20_05215 [Sulfuritalea sp.]|nr:hypothetical protein [Sulfuritalea sp.]